MLNFPVVLYLLVWVVGLALIAKYWLKIRLSHGRCPSKARLDGRTALVTGCNTGIGKETAMDLYKRGARVIMACRNLDKASEAKSSIEQSCEGLQGLGKLVVVHLDLCSLESVRNCAKHVLETESELSLLINNAGVMTCPEVIRPKFEDLNWERSPYNTIQAYALSKAANILFSRELAKKLKEYNIGNVTTYSLHPGVIRTDLGRHLSGVFPGLTWMYYNWSHLISKTPLQGAQTTIYCAIDEKCARESGRYYVDCEECVPWTYSKSEACAKKMWDKSTELLQLGDYNPFTAIDK